jgi:hypothetical protein
LGRPEVSGFLIANALYWLRELHVDGLRVDAVASMLYLDYSRKEGEWIPNREGGRENLDAIDFFKRLHAILREEVPGAFTVAEESTSWPLVTADPRDGGLGFLFKWNMGWMHDTLKYFAVDPIGRTWNHDNLTFAMVYEYSERFINALSHDEVVHGKKSLLSKMPGPPCISSRICVCSWLTCGRDRARSCSSWEASWRPGGNGTRSVVRSGTSRTSRSTAASCACSLLWDRSIETAPASGGKTTSPRGFSGSTVSIVRTRCSPFCVATGTITSSSS